MDEMSDTEYDQWEPLFDTGSTDRLLEIGSDVSGGEKSGSGLTGDQLGEPVDIDGMNSNLLRTDDSVAGSSIDEDVIELPKRAAGLTLDTNVGSTPNIGTKNTQADSETAWQSPSLFSSVVSTFRRDNDSTVSSPSNSVRSSDIDYVISENYNRDKQDGVGRSPSIISHRRQTSLSSRRKLSRNRNSSNDFTVNSPLMKQPPPIEVKIVLQNDTISKNLQNEELDTEMGKETTTKDTDLSSNNVETDTDSTTDQYNHKRFSEETFADTGYHFANKDRNVEFYNIFRNELDSNDDTLIDDFSCGWSTDFLYQGRLYITDKNLCFNSNILGWIQQKIIPLKDIRYLEKTSAVLLPNAILIETNSEKFKFNNFISREKSFNLIKAVWSRNLVNANLEEEEREAISNKERIENDEKNQTIDDKTDTNISTEGHCYKFKPDAKYTNEPPFQHTATDFPDDLDDPNEYVLDDLQLNGTPLQIFQILFSDKNHSFLFDYLASIDCDNIENPTEFEDDDREETSNKDNSEDGDTKVKTRQYSYDKSISIPGGPKSTDCHAKEQIIHYDTDNFFKVVNLTKTPNVPSGNSFTTVTKYLFKWGPQNNCQLKISYWIHWTGSSWIKKIIEKNVKKGQMESVVKFKSTLIKYIDENIFDTENVTDTFDSSEKHHDKYEIENFKPGNNMKLNEKASDNKENINQFKLVIIVLILVILALLLVDIQYQRNNRKYIKRIEKILIDEYLSKAK